MIEARSFRKILVTGTAFAALACAMPAWAQTTDAEGTTQETAVPPSDVPDAGQDDSGKGNEILVTGSRIRQDPNKSALPLQIITPEVLQNNGISSPEQLTMFLTTNGSGADNLASNSDVTTGAQRGTNGLSAVNLRGQGSAATLVLLNGRRVAAHGLTGSAVDINQIPFAAIERVEILKDGASAIYGTDAIGGVVNYITRTDFQGLGLNGFVDATDEGDGNIYSISGIAGYGDLKDQGFNIMGSVSYRVNTLLRGADRDFVNTNQPNRGISVETRGTPIATIFNTTNPQANPSLLSGITLTAPNGGNAAAGGVNILDLPGGAGCTSMDGGLDYDYQLWAAPNNYYACAWDTGRAAAIQQPVNTLTYYARGTLALGASTLYAEVAGSDAKSAKSFSNPQISSGTSLPVAYPRNALTQATYDAIFNSIRSAFPASAAALDARFGAPITFRWRCLACGPREYKTDAKTFRVAGGLDGPLPLSGWDYRVGASYAQSKVDSTLGSGYYYRGSLNNGTADTSVPTAPGATFPGIVGLINAGILNPFSTTQTDAALAALQSVSAEGKTLYGGTYRTFQADASVSGPLFALPGGDVQVAVGVDYRRESYSLGGSSFGVDSVGTGTILLAAVEGAFGERSRNVKAAYGELSVPLFPWLELSGAFRVDDYTGFGTTTNPKVTAKFTPTDWVLFRGSYSTGFRVPTFNQVYNPVSVSPYVGTSVVDPQRCPSGVISTTDPNCAAISFDTVNGGYVNLGPETAKMASAGVVFTPMRRWSASADWWMVNSDNTITVLTVQQLFQNASLFPTRFVRNGAGNISQVDLRYINAGARRTQGLELSGRGGFEFGESSHVDFGIDGTLLLKKREKLTANSAYGPSLIGVFTLTSDLGLRWKHNAWVSFGNKDVSVTLTQIYRDGYKNQVLPGILNGSVVRPDFNYRVSPYIIYNLSASLLSLAPGYKLVFGVKNILDKDPPFAITYDSNSGAGSTWEPRVADPRGRSFTIGAEVKF